MKNKEKTLEQLRIRICEALDHNELQVAQKNIRKMMRYERIEAMGFMITVEIMRGNSKKAEKEFRKLVAEGANITPAHYLVGARAIYEQGKVVEALKILEQTDTSMLGTERLTQFYNLMGQCYRYLGVCDKSVEMYLMSYKTSYSLNTASVNYSNYLFGLHHVPRSIQEQRKAAEGYQEIFKDIEPFTHPASKQEKRKLRIGYISPDLCKHVVLCFSYAFFAGYDHDRFEVFLYANNKEDWHSRHLASIVDGWRNIKDMDPEQAARLIYEDKIDILMDLAGHTKDNCLPVLAYKPAPIQISGIGYFASTGLKTVDYFLGDVHLDPEEAKQGFTEELLLLPDSHFCYAEMEAPPPIAEPAYKKNGYITFGSFNNFSKVNNEVLRVWREILQLVPDARLLLKAEIFVQKSNWKFAMGRMEEAGIPLERVEVRGVTVNYMQEYHDMDIALDTFPYPGGGTTCDALYMGVPVISLRGKSHGERFGTSFLENLGLEELCADTMEGYIKKAVELSQDKARLDTLHKNIRERLRESPVMNAKLYMENIQATYERIWERYLTEAPN